MSTEKLDRKKELEKLLNSIEKKVGTGLDPIDLVLIFLEDELQKHGGNLKSTKLDEVSVDHSPTSMYRTYTVKWHVSMEDLVNRNI